MIIQTEAVVLRKLDYGETSQIVTLFTRERGKMGVIAKGARRMKSQFGSTLQPMSYTQVKFYFKAGRSLQTLAESSHIEPFHRIGRNLEKIAIGLRAIDLVGALSHEGDPNPHVFQLLLQVLHRLNVSESRLANLLPYFQLRLAGALGFAPDFEREAVQRLPDEGGLLALDTGAITWGTAQHNTCRHAGRRALRAFAICARADLDAVMRMQLDPATRRSLNALVEDFLRYHVAEAYPTRSSRVIAHLT